MQMYTSRSHTVIFPMMFYYIIYYMVHTVESRFSKLFGQELKLNRVLTIVLTVGQQQRKYLYIKNFHFFSN